MAYIISSSVFSLKMEYTLQNDENSICNDIPLDIRVESDGFEVETIFDVDIDMLRKFAENIDVICRLKKGKAELFSAHDKQRLCFSVSKTGKIVVDGLLAMVSSKGGVFSLEFENRFQPHFLKECAEGIKASFGAQESADD